MKLLEKFTRILESKKISKGKKRIILNEMHFIQAYQIIKSVPELSKEEFLKKCEPGDIFLVQPKNYTQILKNTRKYLMQLAQRSFATSSKIYIGHKKILGYDVKKDVQAISIAEFEDFSNRYYRIVLVKPRNISEEQRKKFLDFLKSRLGLDYNTSELQKSLWKRIFSLLRFKKERDKEELKQVLKDLKHAFFCSNLISVGLFKAGWKGDFNGNSILDVWPVDFLLSKDFEKIAQFKNI